RARGTGVFRRRQGAGGARHPAAPVRQAAGRGPAPGRGDPRGRRRCHRRAREGLSGRRCVAYRGALSAPRHSGVLMNDKNGYAVFFFPQALEALGDAIKPYLQEGKAGAHVVCREIDTGGALVEMTLDGRTTKGEAISLELMVPTNMVRMVVSARSDEAFGFGPRSAGGAVRWVGGGRGAGARGEVEPAGDASSAGGAGGKGEGVVEGDSGEASAGKKP